VASSATAGRDLPDEDGEIEKRPGERELEWGVRPAILTAYGPRMVITMAVRSPVAATVAT
jgi:hypothetical protein